MKRNRIFIIISYFSLVLCSNFLFSCKWTQQDKAEEEKVEIVGIGKTLLLPDSLETYKPFQGYLLDSNKMLNAPLKIYSHVNVSCSTCLEDIAKWDKLVKEYKVPVILICESKDNFELLKYFCEQGDIKGFAFPFFLDLKGQYVKKNTFVYTHAGFKTVLTDQSNKILFAGDPIHSKVKEREYLSIIKKYGILHGVKIDNNYASTISYKK